MVWKSAVIVGCIAPLSGCLLYERTAHNIKNETVLLTDEVSIRSKLRTEGELIWDEVSSQYADNTFSTEFVDGFLDGYVDYLDYGGKATPPPIPPSRYRNAKYLSEEGHARIRDYFAGFKYGAEVACSSGKREYLTIPVIVPTNTAQPHVQLDQSQVRPRPTRPEKLPKPAAIALPNPKKTDSETAPVPKPKYAEPKDNLDKPMPMKELPKPVPGAANPILPRPEPTVPPPFQGVRVDPVPSSVVPAPTVTTPKLVPINTTGGDPRPALPSVPVIPAPVPASIPATPATNTGTSNQVVPAPNPLLAPPPAVQKVTRSAPGSVDPADLLPVRAPVSAPPASAPALPEIRFR